MDFKIVKFENLYNVDFSVDIVMAQEQRWEENTCGINRFWNVPRSRNGVMYFHNCDGICSMKNGEVYEIKSGELWCIPAEVNYGIKLVNCGEDYKILILDFRMYDFLNDTVIGCSESPFKMSKELLGTFFLHHKKLLDIYGKEPAFYIKRNEIIYSFLADVILAYRKDTQSQVKHMNISKAVEYIEKNYTQPINNEYLAGLCAVSQECFIRTFKKYYNTTPHKYILDLKISKAKEYLANRTLSVSEIADKLGFESSTYFSNMFRKKVGVSPKQYRNL